MSDKKNDKSIQTGTLKFQFNQDEPVEWAKIYNYERITIGLQQSKNSIEQLNTFIEFTSKNGNTFRLFIDNYEQENEKENIRRI